VSTARRGKAEGIVCFLGELLNLDGGNENMFPFLLHHLLEGEAKRYDEESDVS